MLVNGDITSSQFQEAKAQRDLHLKAGRRFTQIREPYFFGYVEDLLQQEYGTNTVRSGGLQGLHDDRAGPAARGDRGDHARADRPDRSGVGDRLDRSAHGRDQGDDRGDAGAQGQPVQLRDERAPAAGLDVQDDHAHGRGRARAWIRSRCRTCRRRSTTSPTRRATRATRTARGTCRRTSTLLGRRVGRERDAAVRQHRLRAARARRRPGEHRRRWRRSSASARRCSCRATPFRRSRSARSA